MATIITADNSTAVLAQLAEQQERMAETIEDVIDQLADQALRSDQHDEQLRTQAAALRSTAAQLSRTIADVAKSGPNPNGGNPGNGNGGQAEPERRQPSHGTSSSTSTPRARAIPTRVRMLPSFWPLSISLNSDGEMPACAAS
jgi:hypothetical protein